MINSNEAHTTAISDDRTFGVWYDTQYDMHLISWQNIILPTDDASGVLQLSQLPTDRLQTDLSHTSAPAIIASLIGFLRRSKMPDADLRKIFIESAQLIPHSNRSTGYHNYELLVDGELATLFDVPSFGWRAIGSPIPAQPVPLKTCGGTGVYTTTQDSESELLFARIEPHHVVPEQEHAAIRLKVTDVQQVASLICRTVAGSDVGDDIAHMLEIEFPSFG